MALEKKVQNRWKCPNPKFWSISYNWKKKFAIKKYPSISIHQKPLKKHWDIWFCELLQFSTLPTVQRQSFLSHPTKISLFWWECNTYGPKETKLCVFSFRKCALGTMNNVGTVQAMYNIHAGIWCHVQRKREIVNAGIGAMHKQCTRYIQALQCALYWKSIVHPK